MGRPPHHIHSAFQNNNILQTSPPAALPSVPVPNAQAIPIKESEGIPVTQVYFNTTTHETL